MASVENGSSGCDQSIHLSSVDQYDTIQLTLTGLSGVDRHLVVTADGLKDILRNNGNISFSRGVSTDSLLFDSVSSCGLATIDMSSLHPLPWISTDDCRVGGVMCHITPPTKADSTPPIVSPRAAALAQISKLKKDFGLEIKSAFEMEFMVYEKDGTVPFNDPTLSHYGRFDTWAGREEVFFDTCQSLLQSGQPLESLLTEMAAGQFEITFAPQRGVASPDSVVIVKEGLRKCLGNAALTPTFMATPNTEDHSNGFHFNHSIWKLGDGSVDNDVSDATDKDNVKKESANAFCDLDDPLLLSSTARHWLAGLIQHGPGLTLLSSPTLNCTRRLQDPLSPKAANWGIENRGAFFRVRNTKGNVYIEDRLPSSACNPYLVVAGVIAAGMDGLRKGLACPPQMAQSAPPLPTTLEEALSCLKKDTVLTEALGQELVSAFLSLTRKSVEEKESRGLSDLNRQIETYFRYI